MQQISQGTDQQETAESADHDMVVKVKSLERDLYYYRKTSRDLRKKLQALTSSEVVGVDSGVGLIVEGVKMAAEERVSSAPELEEGGRSRRRAKKKHRDLSGASGRALESEGGKVEGPGIETAASIVTQSGVTADVTATTSLQEEKGVAAVPNQQVVGGALPNKGGVMPMVVKKHKNKLRQLR